MNIRASGHLDYPDEKSRAGLRRFLDRFELSNFDSVEAIFAEPLTEDESEEELLLRVKAFLRQNKKCFRADIIGDSVMIHGDDAFEAIVFGNFLEELGKISKITRIQIQTEFESIQ